LAGGGQSPSRATTITVATMVLATTVIDIGSSTAIRSTIRSTTFSRREMSDERDLSDLKRKLADCAEDLAVDLFGEPSKRTRNELRWGRKGSTAVKIGGCRAGSFWSFEADQGGSMLDAVAFALQRPFPEAIQWARQWLGEDTGAPRPARRRRPVIQDVDAEEQRRIAWAKRLWQEGRPVAGPPGEIYLKRRAIEAEAWPESVRWHPKEGLIFASTSPKGEMTLVQRIYVNADGTPKRDEEGRKIKKSLGRGPGGAVRFAGRADGPLCLAEGPETALSIWWATGFETWAALGSIASIDLSPVPVERQIVICRDDDPKNAPSLKALRYAIKKWRAEGRTVLEVLPFKLSRREKGDFNDALVEHGPQYLRDRIDAIRQGHDQGHDLPVARLHLPQARKALARATRDAVEDLWKRRDEKPVLALKVGIGLGKTREALISAVRWIRDGRGPVVYAVPTHHLSAELLKRAQEEAGDDVTVAVWRGREAEDPAAPGERMCKDLDTVRAVQAVGGDPQELVCEKSGRRAAPSSRPAPTRRSAVARPTSGWSPMPHFSRKSPRRSRRRRS
ncbi:MAG: toprim domain-containing protein, partial [Rhodospirillales bacterium]|nr:toprim domain-containing protein [Rhodospirillales bacterium]